MSPWEETRGGTKKKNKIGAHTKRREGGDTKDIGNIWIVQLRASGARVTHALGWNVQGWGRVFLVETEGCCGNLEAMSDLICRICISIYCPRLKNKHSSHLLIIDK